MSSKTATVGLDSRSQQPRQKLKGMPRYPALVQGNLACECLWASKASILWRQAARDRVCATVVEHQPATNAHSLLSDKLKTWTTTEWFSTRGASSLARVTI